jgi:serine-type D-Ala-D-Ala carboxypeptidase/endopeptidase (penicillin-binding protein 4)
VLAHGGSGGVVANSMAKAGETGTLATRFNNTLAVGHLQAKTGTLSGVSALAGWARPEGQQPFNFVIITNGVAAQESRSLEDQLAILLVSQPKTNASTGAFAPEGVAK